MDNVAVYNTREVSQVKIPRIYQKYGKKAIALTVALVVVLAAVAGISLWYLNQKKQDASGFGQGMSGNLFTSGNATMSGMENLISASGITSVGILQESFDVENLTQGILIEEVNVSSGQEIAEGDAVLKLSEASVAEAREELEDLLKEADLAYRTGAIEYEQSLITAKYDRDLAVLNGKQAQEIYNETVASLKESVERAEQKLAETKEQIAEYQAITAGGNYYDTYKVGEYKALYDENLELLKSRMEEWDVSWEQVLNGSQGGMSNTGSQSSMSDVSASGNQSSMGDMGNFESMSRQITVSGVSDGDTSGSASGNTSGGNAGTGQSDPGYVTALRALYSVLEQNLKDYEQALADSEDAATNARLSLQTLELSVSSLEESLAQAQANYDSQMLQAKLTLENSLAEAERAENEYDTAVEKAESDYETLKDAWEDATENLALFETRVGDGYYHAAGSGTVMSVMTRGNQYLTGNGMIFMYRNTEKITVTVSVDQADIASIEVGDEVYVQSSDYGIFSGIVTTVNPVSTSASRANVTYQVTVLLNGDTGELPANESVTVIFGIGGQGYEKEN